MLNLVSIPGKKIILFVAISSALVSHTSADVPYMDKSSAHDAARHMLLTGAISFSSCIAFDYAFPNMNLASKYVICGTIGLLPVMAKEAYDFSKAGVIEWEDVSANFIGAGGGILLHYFIFGRRQRKHKTSLGYSDETGMILSYSIRF